MALRTAVSLALFAIGTRAEDGATCGCATSRSAASGGEGGGTCSTEPPSEGSGTCSVEPPVSAAPRGTAASGVDTSAWKHLYAVSYIPPGTAVLGTDSPHFPEDAEGPAYNFTLPSGLWMDTFEVSNARYAHFVGETGYVTEAEGFGWSFVHELAVPEATKVGITQHVQGAEWWLPVPNATWQRPEGTLSTLHGRMDHPALHLSKGDAEAYCTWSGGRLPTEAEWEYASRGGKTKRDFPWGNKLLKEGVGGGGGAAGLHRVNIWQGEFPSLNTGEDGHMWAAPVDAMGPQNSFGLYHITGNVWEWTADTWCPNIAPDGKFLARPHMRGRRGVPPECTKLSPQHRAKLAGDAGEVEFVKKGGSFLCHKSFCYRYRSAARHKNTANSSAYNLGARCVYDTRPPWALPTSAAAGASVPS